MDLIAVLAKSNMPADLCKKDSVPAAEQIYRLLDELDRLVHPSCWREQGELVFSRIAWHITESDLSTKEKVQCMQQLRRLAYQHSVKVDRTIMMLFDKYRYLEIS